VTVGDRLPGFSATEVQANRLLTLRGRHRFSVYELRFELSNAKATMTRLVAKSSACFPGLKGSLYRALVIGTGSHRIAVGRILACVARSAEGDT
jgi:hypothetical protein